MEAWRGSQPEGIIGAALSFAIFFSKPASKVSLNRPSSHEQTSRDISHKDQLIAINRGVKSISL
jgi:hypothetical protein